MTRFGYIFAKLFSICGITRAEKYQTEAAFEGQLLRDSEMVMGELVWKNMEKVEEVSAEYWRLRKLNKKEEELDEQIAELTERLETSQEARAVALEEVAEATKDMVYERDQNSEKIERLRKEKEDILRDGRTIKRAHSGLKTKLEVLLEESDQESQEIIETTRSELKKKKTEFESIRKRRDVIDERIAELQTVLNSLNSKIEAENQAIRERAEEQFGTIGKTNKDLAALRNELGVILSEKLDLCATVGNFVISHSRAPEVRRAAHTQKGLLALITEVRRSSARHKKLLG